MSQVAAAPLLLLIAGPPGAGKTSIGRRLAADLGLPFFSKDDLKETLFESLGWSDREWSRRLGVAAYDLLYLIIETELRAGRACAVESNFRPGIATGWFLALQERLPYRPVQVYCTAERDVLVQRFAARDVSGERHPGHVDAGSHVELGELLDAEVYGPLDIGGPVIEVDTTNWDAVEYDNIRRQVRVFAES